MAEEDLWFEPVSLLDRCSLNEGLLWVWGERVPISNIYREKNAFETLQDWECEELKIPPAPKGVRRAAHHLTEECLRSRTAGIKPKDAQDFLISDGLEEAQAVRQWLPVVMSAMELHASELFVKLRRGEIEAMGKILPNGAAIIDFLEDQNSYGQSKFEDLVDTVIPHDYWTMAGIDWLSNAVTAYGSTFCDVSMSVDELMRLFPGERDPVIGAEFVGNCVLVKESAEGSIWSLQRKARGRPPVFAWDAFHVEVADLIKSGRIPRKKEAAIQHMINWFASTQAGQLPSRSAVSEKLTPYYRRFFADRNEHSVEPQ